LLLGLSWLGGCALVAGLGDFEPDDDDGVAGSGETSSSSIGPGGGQPGGAGPGSGGAGAVGGNGASTGGAGGLPGNCDDGAMNGDETGEDCGGSCPPCPIGEGCEVAKDCVTGVCGTGNLCACSNHLVISELRTRGLNGAGDDFVEIYNPFSTPVTLTADAWSIDGRSGTGATYTPRWISTGETIAPYSHLLIVGANYISSPPGDAVFIASITDDASVVLKNNTTTIDAVCICINCTFTGVGHICEGAKVANPTAGDDTDASIERKVGGAAGNCVDTGDNGNDFAASMPAKPQNADSPPTPTP